MAALKRFLSRLYWEKGWRFPLHELQAYAAGVFLFWAPVPKTVVVFGQGRTGSTLLMEMLSNFDEVWCDGEIFGASMPRRVLFPKFYLKALARWRGRGKKYYAYRIKIYELWWNQKMDRTQAALFFQSLVGDDDKVVYLDRSDKFRQALSSLVAEARGAYHVRADEGTREPVRVEAHEIPQRVKDLQWFSEQELSVLNNIPRLHINYERDLLDARSHQNTFDLLAEFLSLPTRKVNITLRRTSDENLERVVENYQELTHAKYASDQ